MWLFLTSYGSRSIDTTGPIRLDKELELPVVIIPVQDHRGSLGSKGILWDKTGEVINKDSSHNIVINHEYTAVTCKYSLALEIL